jgi:8-oxo-dGTP pyrophosphatase MutT (NUDIX family)
MTTTPAYPIPCTAVFILNENQELLTGFRPAEGIRCIPGGKIDLNEGMIASAIREVKEETGLDIKVDPLPIGFSDDIWPEKSQHFLTIYFQAKVIGGELGVGVDPKETTKITDLQWTPISAVTKLFTGCERILPQLRHSNPFQRALQNLLTAEERYGLPQNLSQKIERQNGECDDIDAQLLQAIDDARQLLSQN